LADRDRRILGVWDRFEAPTTANKIVGTLFNAYFPDVDMAEIFARIYQDLPTLLKATEATRRINTRQKKLNQLMEQRRTRGGLHRSDLIGAFRALGDPMSLKIASAIENGSFELQILPSDKFQKSLDTAEGIEGFSKDIFSAYAPAGVHGDKGVMTIREIPLADYPRERAVKRIFEVLTDVVHEFEHHEHMDPADPNVGEFRDGALRNDIMAYAQEYYWRALHGDNQFLIQACREGNGGLAMYLRNHVEEWLYPKYEKASRLKPQP